MIWLRRAVAILLAIIFIFLSVLVLVAFRVSGTVGNPDFYAEQLQQADVYQFIYDDVLPAALEEVGVSEDAEGAGTIITSLKPQLVGVVRQTVPPEWLQEKVEHNINEVVPYVWGEKDTFSITIPLKDRVEAGGGAVKDLLHQDGVFPVLYERLIELAADEMAPAENEMPDMLAISGEEMKAMLRRVMPEDWLLAQMDNAIDETVPFFTKEQEHFAVEIDIARPLDELEQVVVDILLRPEAYDSLLADMLLPALKQNIGEVTVFPLGAELTDGEIVATARVVLTLEWYQELVQDIVGQIFAYLRGEQDDLELVINLADRKPEMAEALSQLADAKMESAFDSLPVCSESELLEFLSDPSLENIPACRSIAISYQELKELVDIDVGNLGEFLVEAAIPDEWTLAEAEINQLFGGKDEDNVLNQLREVMLQGLTFTDGDLIEIMDTDAVALEDIRQLIADGIVFTEQDFRDLMSDTEEGGTSEQLMVFEQVRSGLGTAKKWINFIWLLPLLMIVGVGALGGRQWSSRLIWAAAALALMAIISYIVFGPVFSATAQPVIGQALSMELSKAEGMTLLIAEKANVVAHNVIDSFISGLRNQSLGLIIAAVVLIGGGVVWHNWDRIHRV